MNIQTIKVGTDRLRIIPPKYLKMIITTVQPVKGSKKLLDVTCQEWRLIYN